jgi:predicted nucleic acid-binding protein
MLITSRISFVEARSALARARRGAAISAGQLRTALDLFDGVWADALVIEVDESVTVLAGQLVLDRALRSLDGVQLASALIADATEGVAFACWDSRLREAASAEGMQLIPKLRA